MVGRSNVQLKNYWKIFEEKQSRQYKTDLHGNLKQIPYTFLKKKI